jgi:hypothetical protein
MVGSDRLDEVRSSGPFVALIVASGAFACGEIIGIGDPKLAAVGGGGAGGEGGEAGGEGGSGGDPPPPPCHPTDPLCNQVESECLAIVDNDGADTFALRFQQATIWKPDAFSSGLENAALQQNLTMNLEECNLFGGGTINIVFELNKTTSTGRVGAAYPVAEPSDGYTFVDEVFQVDGGNFFNAAPAIVSAHVEADGTIVSEEIGTLTLPLFLDLEAMQYILVPLRRGRMFDATLSADQNCIGAHNAAGLSPDNGCLPDPATGVKAFIDGGKIDGYILLEEADQIIVEAFGLNRSLCVVLARDAAEFGDGGSPIRCAYLDGKIKYPGDWCSTTNAGATANCHDAAKFAFSFAASAVRLNR